MKNFRGFSLRRLEFIQICLESYGERLATNEKLWQIRHEDLPEKRQIDIESARRNIQKLAERCEVSCVDLVTETTTLLSWKDKKGDLDFLFFPTISTMFGEVILFSGKSPKKGVIVLPGSRANLVIYKLHRDPRLSKAISPSHGNWQFLKFRHLKSLVENPILNRENIEQLLTLDPLTYSTPQLRLI